jgi:hypothetical protein
MSGFKPEWVRLEVEKAEPPGTEEQGKPGRSVPSVTNKKERRSDPRPYSSSIVLLYQFRPACLDNVSDFISPAYSSTYRENRQNGGLTRFPTRQITIPSMRKARRVGTKLGIARGFISGALPAQKLRKSRFSPVR